MNQIVQQLIDQYQPSQAAKDLVATHPPVLLAGVSGAGKDYLTQHLLATGNYYNLVTHTTRTPRQNRGVWEQEAQDYYFVDLATAEAMLRRQEFIEAKLVHGETVYGSSLAEYQRAIDSGKTPLADVDVQGVAEYKKISPEVRAVFLLPPSFEVWLERLRQRFASAEEFEVAWAKRRVSSVRELEFALESGLFDWVVNDDVNQAVAQINQLLSGSDKNIDHTQAQKLAHDLLTRLQQN